MDEILFEKKNNIYIQFIYNTIHSLLIFNTIISTLYFRRNENRTIFDFFFALKVTARLIIDAHATRINRAFLRTRK